MNLQAFIQQVEDLISRIVSPAECAILNDLYKDYEVKDILYWVEFSKFKDRPINYARALIMKKCQKKNQETGSEWLDKLKEIL